MAADGPTARPAAADTRCAEGNGGRRNPPHYAVALRYRPSIDTAPAVLAKGMNDFALRIREAAFQAGVPIRENPGLARALYPVCKAGKLIPEHLYRAVAVLIAWGLKQRRANV